MGLAFLKMQAQGNDFVVLDGRHGPLPEIGPDLVCRLADRRFGIGCDQVLLLGPAADAAASMRVFNNDGSTAETCGNGLRCVGYLLLEETGSSSLYIRVNGRLSLIERGAGGVHAHLGPARITAATAVHVDVDLGNPHRVFFEAIEALPADRNIEIVSGQVADHAYVDVIERGAGRTPACGSGACAVAAAIWHREDNIRPLTICMPGGELKVAGTPDDLVLAGEVTLVFRGEYLPSLP